MLCRGTLASADQPLSIGPLVEDAKSPQHDTRLLCQQENDSAINSAALQAPVPAPLAAAKAAAPAAPATPEEREQQMAALVCSLENKDACLMCGS